MKILAALTATIVTLTSVAGDIVSQFEDIPYEYDYDEPVVEYVYCTVDASKVSLGEIIPLTRVEFNGESCADIIIDVIEQSGYTALYDGTTDEGFYLWGIEGIDTNEIYLSEEVKIYLNEENIDYSENVYEEGVLGEFDITKSAGWVYTINGEMPSVGLCDYIPAPDDEIKLSFSLNYGEDLN